MKSPFGPSKRRFTLAGINDSVKAAQEFKGTMRKTGAGLQGGVFAPMYSDLLYNNIAQYQIPKNKKLHNSLMAQIYNFDPIAGPAVDLYSDFPWSSFDMSGVEDPAVRHIYEDALNNLKIEYYLPQITANFFVYGRVCLHFLFDQGKGVWTNFILHRDEDIEITPVPFFNEDPLVNFIPSAELKGFVLSKDPRTEVYKNNISPQLLRKITQGGSIPLDVSNTLYLPRKVLPSDYLGTSLYSRIIGLITLERALMNASTVKAQRSAGPLRMLKMGRAGGTDGWLPTDDEIQSAISAIMMAEEDPVASVIAFKTPDVTVDLLPGSGSDGLWKISDEYEFIQGAKFKALGISDQMLSGDASYNNMEQALSIFLERIKTHRDFFTRKILVEKIFEPLAKAHGFYKKKNVLNPKLKTSARVTIQEDSDSALILPIINWHKALEPRMDQSLIDLYQAAEDHGIPVMLKDWGRATGISLSELDTRMTEDLLLRKEIKAYKDKMEAEGIDSEMGGSSSEDSWGSGGSEPSGGPSGGPEEMGDDAGEEPGSESMTPVEQEPTDTVDKIPPPPPSNFRKRRKSEQVRIDVLESQVPSKNVLSGV